jgi:calcineurin-like phosphoesterase family protein
MLRKLQKGAEMIWIISDTHFGHKMLIENKIRPIDFENKIITFLCNNVKTKDTLINLGDFSFCKKNKHVDTYSSIECKKILVRGNHDNYSFAYYNMIFNFVCDSFMLDMFGKKILFTHEPVEKKGGFDINIHGHLHNFEYNHHDYNLQSHNMLVALENTGYCSVSLKKILTKFCCNEHETKE